jgi:hypothetical protein
MLSFFFLGSEEALLHQIPLIEGFPEIPKEHPNFIKKINSDFNLFSMTKLFNIQ